MLGRQPDPSRPLRCLLPPLRPIDPGSGAAADTNWPISAPPRASAVNMAQNLEAYMSRSIDALAEWCDPTRTVLVLGAGASIPSGGMSGSALGRKLAKEFDQDYDLYGNLSVLSDVIENKHGRRPLTDALRKILDFEPHGGLQLLPTFRWRSIYTTNFDRALEKAASQQNIPYAAVRSIYDVPEIERVERLRIFKLHGCLSQDRAYGDPSSMIITRADYRAVRRWKKSLLDRLQVDLETAKVLVLGQSLADPHLDELIHEIAELQLDLGYRDRVSILAYQDTPDLAAVFEANGIVTTMGDIDSFVGALLAEREAKASNKSTVSLAETDTVPLLGDPLIPVTIDVARAVRLETSVRKMFSGNPSSYFDINADRTFPRDLVAAAVTRIRQTGLCAIVGAAGLGKTTAARQVMLKFREEGFHTWEHRQDTPLNPAAWMEVDGRLASRGEAGILLLDNATAYQRQVNDLLRLMSSKGAGGLKILVTAERHRWYRLTKHPSLLRPLPISPSRLSDSELSSLLTLVTVNHEVRSLVPPSFLDLNSAAQRTFLRRQCNSDIFICLRNIFSTSTFDSIVLREFNDLDGTLQDIYRMVAAIESIAGGSHRQLVMRTLGIEPTEIDSLLGQLDGLLTEATQSRVDGVFVWKTRHPEIADIITRFKYADPQDHLELIEDLVDNLNPTVNIERSSIRGLCLQPLGLDLVHDREVRISLLERLIDKVPDDHVLRHRIVREFLRAGLYADAGQALEIAIREVGTDPPLQRFQVELYRLRSANEPGLSPTDRASLLRWAWMEANEATLRYPDNWFTWRSLLEVGSDWSRTPGGDRDWLEDALARSETAFDRLYEPRLEELIRKARSGEL